MTINYSRRLSIFRSKLIVLAAIVSCLTHKVVYGIHLECDYAIGAFVEIGEENSIYCEAKNVKIVTPFEVVEGLTPNYTNNDDVKGLSIANQTVDNIPFRINDVFKDLRGLQIYNSVLKIIAKHDLQPFPHLKGLYLQLNQLNAIEKDLFVFNKELQYINFYGNNLKHIDIETLPLFSLTFVDFGGNRCIDLTASANNPAALQELKAKIQGSCQNKEVAQGHDNALSSNDQDNFIRFHEPVMDIIRDEFAIKLAEAEGKHSRMIKEISQKHQEKVAKLEFKLERSNQQVEGLLTNSKETAKILAELKAKVDFLLNRKE